MGRINNWVKRPRKNQWVNSLSEKERLIMHVGKDLEISRGIGQPYYVARVRKEKFGVLDFWEWDLVYKAPETKPPFNEVEGSVDLKIVIQKAKEWMEKHPEEKEEE